MPGYAGAGIRAGQWMLGDGYADYEHAVLSLGGNRIVEARPSGAAIRYLTETSGFLWYACPDDKGAEIAERGARLQGTPYSFADYAALAAHRFHVPGGDLLKDYIAESSHMICSQLVDYAYMWSGVHLFNDKRWPGYVTPGALRGLIPA